MKGPKTNEFEITLLGPGFGESLVIHLGDNRWIVIDSCIDSETNRPAALVYLENIGVDPALSVSHVIATHWHDDHIGGMATLIKTCTAAEFCCGAVLTDPEFIKLVKIFNQRSIAVSTGLAEIDQVLELLMKRGDEPRYVLGDLPILTLPATANAPIARVTALSPVNAEYVRFLQSLARYVPSGTKRRFPRPDENDISIASIVVAGDVCVLLGADLETKSNPKRGWDAVLTSSNRPAEIASLFKVPHHGSVTGHHDDVWKKMLISQPVAILTPWNRGSKLPHQSDRTRIAALADRSFITSKAASAVSAVDYAIAKTIRESKITISVAEPQTGRITARIPFSGATAGVDWSIDLSPEASGLSV